MFNLHDFVMDTIHSMIGKEPEYKVRQYALGWFEREVLTEYDLSLVEGWLADQAAAQAQASEEVPE